MTHQIGDSFRLSVAQLNSTVGDILGNCEKVRAARAKAKNDKADLLLMSELFVSGYPTDDLVLKPAFIHACRDQLELLATETDDGGPAILVGAPWNENDSLFNGIFLLDKGEIKAKRFKVDLPNYEVFDEKRLFSEAKLPSPIDFRGLRIGAPICEDFWHEEVAECLMESGAEILLIANCSPFSKGCTDRRIQNAVKRVVENELPIVFVNQVGGHEELVFDGGTFALNSDRQLAMQLNQFEEVISTMNWRRTANGKFECTDGVKKPLTEIDETLWTACVLGIYDYVKKNKFEKVVLGLSGGIDSAVCATMAVDALGAENVHCVMLPYHYTSSESLADATECAKLLGVSFDEVSIVEPVESINKSLSNIFKGQAPDKTEENIQSRVRGTMLMAISNKNGSLLLTTGNKSEGSVGYATLYGDMNGGFNPIKDLYKTEVYRLAEWRNVNKSVNSLGPEGKVIPQNIINKAPTAELKEGQKDQDSLPPYEKLDDILECLIENEMSVADISKRGHPRAEVERVEHLLYCSEFKRRQAPPGVRLTQKGFGKDRRYPIINEFRDRA